MSREGRQTKKLKNLKNKGHENPKQKHSSKH
jgi:hypothetical protein